MDNFKAVYKILSALEKAMDCPEFDIEQIGSKAQREFMKLMREAGRI